MARSHWAIELDNVSFAYAGAERKILRNVSLKIRDGDFVGVVGRTGCGKTTLLLTLNGAIPKLLKGVFSGVVRVFGEEIAHKSVSEVSKIIAFVFQDPNDQIFCSTVEEEIGFALKMQRLDEREARHRISLALAITGLRGFEERDPTTLSQGQKQKLALATAIAMRTPIIVCDEPISNLDYENACRIYEILSKLNHCGRTVIIAEHEPEFLWKYANKIVALDGGRIVFNGGKQVLRSPRVKRFGLKKLK